MSIGAVRFVPPQTAMAAQARPAARATGTAGFSGSLPGPTSTSQTAPRVSGMDVLRHLVKRLAAPQGGAGMKASQPPATTQPSDSSLMTYSRRDMPRLRMDAGSAGNAGMPGGQNPFKAAKIR